MEQIGSECLSIDVHKPKVEPIINLLISIKIHVIHVVGRLWFLKRKSREQGIKNLALITIYI